MHSPWLLDHLEFFTQSTLLQMEHSFNMQKSWGSMGEGETDEVLV